MPTFVLGLQRGTGPRNPGFLWAGKPSLARIIGFYLKYLRHFSQEQCGFKFELSLHHKRSAKSFGALTLDDGDSSLTFDRLYSTSP